MSWSHHRPAVSASGASLERHTLTVSGREREIEVGWMQRVSFRRSKKLKDPEFEIELSQYDGGGSKTKPY